MIACPWYLSDLGKQEERLKGELNTQPQTRPVCGTFPYVGERLQGHLFKESNQDSQIVFPPPLYPFFFFFLHYKIHNLTKIKKAFLLL